MDFVYWNFSIAQKLTELRILFDQTLSRGFLSACQNVILKIPNAKPGKIAVSMQVNVLSISGHYTRRAEDFIFEPKH